MIIKEEEQGNNCIPYHPHFGEVNQAFLCEVGCSLLNESQVSEVHAQVRDTWRVTATHTHMTNMNKLLKKGLY